MTTIYMVAFDVESLDALKHDAANFGNNLSQTFREKSNILPSFDSLTQALTSIGKGEPVELKFNEKAIGRIIGKCKTSDTALVLAETPKYARSIVCLLDEDQIKNLGNVHGIQLLADLRKFIADPRNSKPNNECLMPVGFQ